MRPSRRPGSGTGSGKHTGCVASAEGFGDRPMVFNGAVLLEEIFGDIGRHARAGALSLRRNDQPAVLSQPQGAAALPPTFPLPAEIVESRLVAVLRAPMPDHVAEAARRLASCGVRCVEITMTIPGAFGVIEELAAAGTGEAIIGAGTVVTQQEAKDAIAAGATYLLSPLFAPEVVEVGIANEVPVIPGAATPTEIATAWRSGCAAVKVFPASSLGGPAFISSVRDPLPDIALVPTGGIGAEDVARYLQAGAVAVGVGSPLTGSSLTSGDLTELERRARAFLDAAQRNQGNW